MAAEAVRARGLEGLLVEPLQRLLMGWLLIDDMVEGLLSMKSVRYESFWTMGSEMLSWRAWL